jgi:tetratricopeptide (TPR) repeat protein
VAPVSAVCVGVASQYDALTTEEAGRAEAVSQGHRFAVVVVGLALASSLLALVARWGSRRIPTPPWAPRAVNVGLAGSAALAVVVGLVLAGGPRDAVAEFESRFEAAPVDIESRNLNQRLLSISGTWRADIIDVAWDAGNERPVLGHGAGSFEYLWYERRPIELVVRDAHSLYAETFAELGVVGVVLLGGALLVPLGAAVRARRNRVVPASAAAYVAWLAHAGLDWDWEVVGLTVMALLAGSVALLAAERGAVRAAVPDWARWPLLAVSVVLTAFALVSLVGNQALFAGREALAREEWQDADTHARRAEALLPWSFEPHIVLGDAAAGLGDRQRAVEQYRLAVEANRRNWIAWLRLGQVARGAERRAAYERVHELNPLERDLPGEPDGESP